MPAIGESTNMSGFSMSTKFTRKDFLEILFGRYFRNRTGFVLVKSGRRLEHKISARYFPNIETLAKERYGDDQNVFFGVCPREKMKPGPEHVRYLLVLWAGLDMSPDGYSGRESHFSGPAQAAKAIRSFPLAPSIVVESGWGVHLYWLLKHVYEITDVTAIERQLSRINDYFLCKQPVGVDSMLRLPGTANSKVPGQTANCNVKFMNPQFRYELEEFQSLNLEVAGPSIRLGRMKAHGSAGEAHSTASPGPQQGPAPMDKTAIDESEVEEFLAADASRSTFQGDAPPGMDTASAEIQEPQSAAQTQTTDHSTIRIETATEAGQDLVEILSEGTSDDFADTVADRVVTKLKDQLVDEIVDKLLQRLKTERIK